MVLYEVQIVDLRPKDAYLAYPVSIRSDSLAVKRVNPDKMYLIDTGLIRAMNAKMDQEKGWLLENSVSATPPSRPITYMANSYSPMQNLKKPLTASAGSVNVAV